ncbi:MAG: ABC transporter ATP-binding protein [Clostridia bacterium]|nr:ABC transporter ATP-binding protein [Clostridia bacterium]
MEDILKVENLCCKYQAENGEVEALKNIGFSIKKGEIVGIIGPSGCGKSTLLSIIAGLEKKTSGSVIVAGQEVSGVNSAVGYMMQNDNLLEWRNIYRNVLLGLEIRKECTEENREYAKRLLEEYGLGEFCDKYPSQLSGGMRQRVALIRTLATRPEILLLDEAFSALDYQTRLKVSQDVWEILKREGVTAVMVTHDIPEAISLSDRVMVLTPRPARIKNIHTVDMTEPPMKRRNDSRFSGYFNLLWEEIN